MNERQKKIMVPYQEPMDTCPDCSEHPCDCGLPAGYKSDIRFAANFAPHIKVMEASKVAEIIQQRDELLRYNEAFRQDALICADCDAISKKEYDRAIEQRDGLRSAVDYASDQLIRITEQRDKEREIYQKSYSAELARSNHYKQQRDKMVEALERILEYQGRFAEEDPQGIAREALQSLNQPKKYDANEHQSFYP